MTRRITSPTESIRKYPIIVFLCLLVSGCSFFDSDVESFPTDTAATPAPNSMDEEGSAEPKSGEEAEDSDDDGPEFGQDDYLRRAENAYDRGLYSLARENWVKLRDEYPASPFESFAQLKIADTFFFGGDYASAIPIYEEFLKLHPGHEGAAYTRLQIAHAFRQQYTGPAHDQSPIRQAQINYERVLTDYPTSYLRLIAAEGIAFCKKAGRDHEEYVADFYRRAGQDKATMGRLAQVEKPTTRAAQKNDVTEIVKPIELAPRTLTSTANTTTTSVSPLPSAPPATTDAPQVMAATSSAPRERPIQSAGVTLQAPAAENPNPPVKSQQNEKIPTAPQKTVGSPVSGRIQSDAARSICKDLETSSVVELPFSGKFELRVGKRHGTHLLAELIFNEETDAAVLNTEKSFTRCQSKRLGVVLGPIREHDEGFTRNIRLDFSPGSRYRVFPLNSPERLVAVAFEN